eukprot:Hpha_TRINITY_DN16011_c5_g5::TRINITY_DN16011_c5_g5_i1::g.119655::m.119655
MAPVFVLLAATAVTPLFVGGSEGAGCVGACDEGLRCVLGKCRQSEDPCKADCEDPAKMGCAMCCWAATTPWRCGNENAESDMAACCSQWSTDCYTTDAPASHSYACRNVGSPARLRKAGTLDFELPPVITLPPRLLCGFPPWGPCSGVPTPSPNVTNSSNCSCDDDLVLSLSTDTLEECLLDCWVTAGQGGSERCTHSMWDPTTKVCLGSANCDCEGDHVIALDRPTLESASNSLSTLTVPGATVKDITISPGSLQEFHVTLEFSDRVSTADVLAAILDTLKVPREVIVSLKVANGTDNSTGNGTDGGQVASFSCCMPPSLSVEAQGVVVADSYVSIPGGPVTGYGHTVEWFPGVTLADVPLPLNRTYKFVIGETSTIPAGTTILVECKAIMCDVQLFLYRVTKHGGLTNGLLPGALEAAGWQCSSCAPRILANSKTGEEGCMYEMAAYRKVVEKGDFEIQLDESTPGDFIIMFGEAAANCGLRTMATCERPGSSLDYCRWIEGTGCIDDWCGKRGVPCSGLTKAPLPAPLPPGPGVPGPGPSPPGTPGTPGIPAVQQCTGPPERFDLA